MSARNVDFKNTNIQPAASESEKADKAKTMPKAEVIKEKIVSIENKRNLLNLLEGYLGNKSSVVDMRKRMDEALVYLKSLEGLLEEGPNNVQNNV